MLAKMRTFRNIVNMRFNRRNISVLLVLCTCLVCFSFWSRCLLDDNTKQLRNSMDLVDQAAPHIVNEFEQSAHFLNRNAKNYNEMEMEIPASRGEGQGEGHENIDCGINKEYTIQCRKEDNEIYMPFSFIQKHFEVYGEFENQDGIEKFEFSNSYSQVHDPPDVIQPDGAFMSFEHYNVEIRKRVKCITAIEGVPVSTQWEPAGHYYPIQIAQFGLSHYSKALRDGEPDTVDILSGDSSDLDDWTVEGKTTVKTIRDKSRNSQVIEYQSLDSMSNPGMTLELSETSNFALKMDIRVISNGSVSVTLKSDDTTFQVHYVFSNTLVTCDGKNIIYGLGENRRGKWIHFVRDVDIDLLKGLALKCSNQKKTKGLTLVAVTLRGHGWVDNITLSSAAHMDHFLNAANWFVRHQDTRGGWPIQVKRKLVEGVMELPKGWYSAMAQGHAISTLVRAYLKYKNPVYLKAAIAALQVFEISSEQGGVKAKFANTYDWYEEYPTTPSSFVLNGFIYSLFGLYDLKLVASGEALETVTQLYDVGMKSLKAMLLMFDSGFGTFYDLRHVMIGVAPNRARWDYHTTHIAQVLQLSKMDDDLLFPRTSKRWIDYMKGKRSPHN